VGVGVGDGRCPATATATTTSTTTTFCGYRGITGTIGQDAPASTTENGGEGHVSAGYALAFDNSLQPQYVSIPDVAALHLAAAITIEAWVSVLDTSGNCIVCKTVGTETDDSFGEPPNQVDLLVPKPFEHGFPALETPFAAVRCRLLRATPGSARQNQAPWEVLKGPASPQGMVYPIASPPRSPCSENPEAGDVSRQSLMPSFA
jgi:hypothetical protein